MKIIVSGGGTGGHIYPALTIISHIKTLRPQAEFLYVGTSRGVEADIVPKAGLKLVTLNLSGFERRLTLRNLVRGAKALSAVGKAYQLVQKEKPDLVIGTGGYVCGPILLAASLKHIPTLIQEQNVVAGITNKLLSRFVDKIAVGVKEAMSIFPASKAVYTGNPIRSEVVEVKREESAQILGLDAKKTTVLISGGSRGASSINTAMIGVLKEAINNPSVQYLLVTGKTEYSSVISKLISLGINNLPEHIKVEPYLYNMPAAEAVADLAVFRAGAMGIAELTARGVPAILVPYPYATGNHQEYNARVLEKHGAAKVILNRELTADTLSIAIKELLSEPSKLTLMAQKSKELGKPEAAATIAKIALEMAESSSS